MNAIGGEDVIIDVGAHIGTFSLLAASKLVGGRVHAVEASQETYNYLRINAALNPKLPITTHHLALTDKPGVVTLHHDKGNWGHSIMMKLSSHGEKVQATSLNHLVAENSIGDIALIKFNCEGAEFPILMATDDPVLRRVKMMLILYHADLAPGFTMDALLTKLKNVGFKTDVRQPRTHRGWIMATRE
jgi:FkbM family methyltransferase